MEDNFKDFKAGFVNIIGNPNVGKSTLMNALVGERISIITSKEQTTRHRIMGILNGDNFQIVYSDTPGIIRDPKYKLQESMNSFVAGSMQDSDVLIYMTDIFEYEQEDKKNQFLAKILDSRLPAILVLNKIDLDQKEKTTEIINYWRKLNAFQEIIPISALEKFNLELLFDTILGMIPNHPPFFDQDALTDRPERFFVEEIIREKIFQNYSKEVPYSTQVEVEEFREEEGKNYIRATIYVERDSQKGIIIGKKGAALKKVGISACKDIELFLDKSIDLRLFVKVKEKWRSSSNDLRGFGYSQ